MLENVIIQKLDELGKMIESQSLLSKDVLNLNEAASYLDVSQNHLYKLTSTKRIPHFCPNGKKLYFKRTELDEWLLSNRQTTSDEIEKMATNYILKNKRP
ncbi:helix-turn-helix domain-containing protein [Flavobacterium caeni]|uniref:DNA binding domain-containing protein, excisionase family n=1 Tax=Flavobacterium caeni TaxID=490189 RepID=A0A1G5JWI2_9FLAO|nr:helix-turn-helix domain-containing protein [Flavobacterium caeni]SCY92715.1 DNA binding domain-containing protein, excisionase family [Flavobacterium caeni]